MEDMIARLNSEIAAVIREIDAADLAHVRAAAATRKALAEAGISDDKKLELLHDAAQKEEAWALGHYQHLKNKEKRLLEDRRMLVARLPSQGECALLPA